MKFLNSIFRTTQFGPMILPSETERNMVARLRRAQKTNVEHSTRKAENRLTRISMAIVWLFIFCHAWKLIPTIYDGIAATKNGSGGGKWPEWLSYINDISHTLIVFNSAVNFLIYAVK